MLRTENRHLVQNRPSATTFGCNLRELEITLSVACAEGSSGHTVWHISGRLFVKKCDDLARRMFINLLESLTQTRILFITESAYYLSSDPKIAWVSSFFKGGRHPCQYWRSNWKGRIAK